MAGQLGVNVGTVLGAADGTNVREVDPISRIEGHLGVKLGTSGGFVTEADVHGNLWRGFENFLLGREVNDAITFTQRICGVCPVPHGMTSTYAADAVLGYSRSHITFADDGTYGVPVKAVYIRNLVLGAEFLMSSITHFYHLAAPSYVQGPAIPPWTPYFDENYYHPALSSLGKGEQVGGRGVAPKASGGFSIDVWSTVIRSYVTALRIRRLTFDAGALFAGRMPMTSTYVGGGVTFDKSEDLSDRCAKFAKIMEEIGRFIVKEYVPIALTLGALYQTFDNNFNGGQNYGGGVGNFLAWGAFPTPDATGALTLPGGVYTGGTAGSIVFQATNKATVYSQFIDPTSPNAVPNNLKEDITYSRYADSLGEYDANNQAYPGAVSRTEPNRANGYTYAKAPRWNGQPMEVGPFARLVVAGYYKVDGTALAATVPGYLGYARAFNAGVTEGVEYPAGSGNYYGVDPRMVEADIAVALFRAGLATVHLPDGTAVTDEAVVVANYSSAILTGTVPEWILGIKGGLSTMDRLRARALESLVLVQAMVGAYDKTTDTFANDGWIAGLDAATGDTWKNKAIPTGVRQGWGATEAPRGALMHQCTINNGKITKYQCIVPTTWNMSPKDNLEQRGPIEQAMIGAPYSEDGAEFIGQAGGTIATQGGVEALRIAQSFDPCIACAIH